MSNTFCQNCRAAKISLYLCTDCIDMLQSALEQIPELLRELEVTVTRQDKLHAVSGRSSDQPSPINFGASRLSSEIEDLLIKWVDLLVAAGLKFFPAMSVGTNFIGPLLPHWQRLPKGYSGSPTQRARWLSHHVHDIARHKKAGEVYEAVMDLTGDPDHPSKPGRLVQAVDKVVRLYAGTCPTMTGRDREGQVVVCGRDLWSDEDQPEVSCPDCEQDIDVKRNRERMIMERDVLPEKKILQVCASLGENVYSDLIQKWLKTGRLRPHGYLHGDHIIERRRSTRDARLFSLSRVRALRFQDQMAQAAS